MKTNVVFSKKSDEWATPQSVFDDLNKEFSFTLDAASTHENAKCKKHYTMMEDGLKQAWDGERVWCNPPYSNVGKWVEKAANISKGTIAVMLIPARTDTRWFHEYINGKAEIRFIKGRLKFGEAKNSAPFPSMVVVFRG